MLFTNTSDFFIVIVIVIVIVMVWVRDVAYKHLNNQKVWFLYCYPSLSARTAVAAADIWKMSKL